ncbi:DUF1842 domain-containing protein [Mucilaginibacter sp. AW1-3]
MSTSTPLAGLFQLCLLAEKPGLLGAPVFNLKLLVYPAGQSVTGLVHISQSVTPQGAPVVVNVHGTLHEMVFGAQVTKVITLSGQYVVSFPPPAIGSYLANFSATLVFNQKDAWTGVSNFAWGHQTDNGVPTHSVPC